MAEAETAYAALEKRFARIARIDEASGWLHWDQSVTMPPGGAEARGEQSAALAEVSHEILASAETGDLLAKADAGGDPWREANLREMRRRYVAATALSSDLVGKLARAASASETAWRSAREASDFSAALPTFAALVELVKEQAAALGSALKLSPYDALLAQYDPGRRAAEIRPTFERLKLFLGDAIPEIVARQAHWPADESVRMPAAKQRAAGLALLKSIGFNFHHGRLDDSIHPFSTGTAEDARITARWDEADALSGLMAVLHEAGHAAYTRAQPKNWRGQPVGDDAGMTVHESQSLAFEMQAGRTPAMAGFIANLLDADGDAVHRTLVRVEPGYIRVEADEATYPLHVILRFELEQALVAGDLEPADLKDAWNAEVTRNLALPAPGDREGCLQDIHWFDGAFGYFPTYTLGALAAAQLFETVEEKVGAETLTAALARGDYEPLVDWMGRLVHAHGRRYPSSNALMEAATGAPVGVEAFERHIRRRYLI